MLKKKTCKRCFKEFFYDEKNYKRKYCGTCQANPKAPSLWNPNHWKKGW